MRRRSPAGLSITNVGKIHPNVVGDKGVVQAVLSWMSTYANCEHRLHDIIRYVGGAGDRYLYPEAS